MKKTSDLFSFIWFDWMSARNIAFKTQFKFKNSSNARNEMHLNNKHLPLIYIIFEIQIYLFYLSLNVVFKLNYLTFLEYFAVLFTLLVLLSYILAGYLEK